MTTEWTMPDFFNGPPQAVATQLEQYFLDYRSDMSGPLYTGAMFERIGGSSVRVESPNEYTALDLVAVSMLSVDVPARASIGILGPDAGRLTELLGQIPTDLDLADADSAVIGRQSPSWALWDHMMAYDKVGPTTASKLLARKRPRLLPIQDSVVVAALHHEKDFWATLHEHLRRDDQALSKWLRAARLAAGVTDDVSELRVFDVLVWTWGKHSN